MSTTPVSPDLDAEQEVDFGRYWRTLAARWWLPLLGVVAGLLIGYLVSLGTSSTKYRGTAQVYLGQPLAPESAAQVSSTPTVLGLTSNLLTSDAVVRRVANRVGLKVGKLRGGISVKPILGVTSGRAGTPAPLLAITVTGAPPAKIRDAANQLAAIAVDAVSRYPDVKIEQLEAQLAFDEQQLAATNERLTLARRQQADIIGNRALSLTERLLLVANITTTVTILEGRLSELEADRIRTRQLLSQAREIERGRIVSPAVATKTEGTSSRTGAAIGALIGLIVGAFAALLWDPVVARRRNAAV